jgi:signal transduction histidine kinase
MTIKRRLFISNILMFVLTLTAFGLTGHIVMSIVTSTLSENEEAALVIDRFRNSEKFDDRVFGVARYFGAFIFFTLLVIVSNVITYCFSRTIIRPLDVLGEGVRQIHDRNLAYRITYSTNDEFRPVCEAFNEMAERLEKSLAQQQKDEANRRELIAGISHDLRTPLTSIKGYLEGLETGIAATPEMKKNYLAVIKNKTIDLEHIIEQLFLFSKLDMDEFPLTLRRADLALAVSEMIQEVESEYARRGLTLKIGETQKGIFVDADVLWLRNVIVNILENSVRYKTKEQGNVIISCAGSVPYVELRFTDDGPGVPAEKLEKLFDVFYRSDPSRNKKGSGIGLAIARKIIERMGGTIHAELPAHPVKLPAEHPAKLPAEHPAKLPAEHPAKLPAESSAAFEDRGLAIVIRLPARGEEITS